MSGVKIEGRRGLGDEWRARVVALDLELERVRLAAGIGAMTDVARAPGRHAGAVALARTVARLARDSALEMRLVGETARLRQAQPGAAAPVRDESEDRPGEQDGKASEELVSCRQNHVRNPAMTTWYSESESFS